MAYATFSDVQTRAGRFQGVFSVSGKHPDQVDVEEMLIDLAAEVDTAIESHGIQPAALDAGAVAALKDLVAYGALSRALEGVTGGRELDSLRGYAREVWVAAMGDPTSRSAEAIAGSIRSGSFPVIADIVAGMAGVSGSRAGDFWDDEPSFGTPGQVEAERRSGLSPELAPTFAKSQPF